MSDSPDPSLKVCLDCGQAKAPDQFWRLAAAPDGLAYYCKLCFRQRNRVNRERREAKGLVAPRTIERRQRADAPEGMKWCPSCETFLAIDDFVRNRSSSDGIGAYCRPCSNAKAKESRDRVHGGSRHYHLKRRYGLGADEVEAMLEEQNGLCPICQRSLSVKAAHVDHDHNTGAVRAVLCFNCNGGLGQFRDDPMALFRAGAYVKGIMWPPTRA